MSKCIHSERSRECFVGQSIFNHMSVVINSTWHVNIQPHPSLPSTARDMPIFNYIPVFHQQHVTCQYSTTSQSSINIKLHVNIQPHPSLPSTALDMSIFNHIPIFHQRHVTCQYSTTSQSSINITWHANIQPHSNLLSTASDMTLPKDTNCLGWWADQTAPRRQELYQNIRKDDIFTIEDLRQLFWWIRP